MLLQDQLHISLYYSRCSRPGSILEELASAKRDIVSSMQTRALFEGKQSRRILKFPFAEERAPKGFDHLFWVRTTGEGRKWVCALEEYLYKISLPPPPVPCSPSAPPFFLCSFLLMESEPFPLAQIGHKSILPGIGLDPVT